MVTRDRLPPGRMIRFVVGPDRVLIPDLAARLPGRGIWLRPARDVLETARTRGAFARAAHGPVKLPPDLLPMLEDALLRRVADGLGLARRAGQVVFGFSKTREWITGGRAGLIVQAVDGSRDERSRILSGARGLPVLAVMTGERLGAAFGRDHVVHAALAPGALAERLLADGERYAGIAGLAAPMSLGQPGDGLKQAGA
ncbi:RNA-binding protein [Acetobacteraceae bacterium KSS12]|uniref:RNA-binding protein n=1 Tax=Rhizosaccharibacter radicis TaxID=2782605 RepID=A0ABT1VYV5_9PROT|nr:RNA-binding protein [Acetobacteraceae bacterium KSS12]